MPSKHLYFRFASVQTETKKTRCFHSIPLNFLFFKRDTCCHKGDKVGISKISVIRYLFNKLERVYATSVSVTKRAELFSDFQP